MVTILTGLPTSERTEPDQMKPATHWQLRSRTLAFGQRPLLMGIVNVTPDSFSDGGRFRRTPSAVDHALRLVDDGADIIDIGGESTRPYADIVSVDEELNRVLPVIEAVCRETPIPVSIDTSKSIVAEAAVAAGAEIINDVRGLEGDPDMPLVASRTNAAVCAMHMQGTPQTMQDNPQYENVVEEVLQYLTARRDALIALGIERSRICLDPGVGFGKTHQHNLDLLMQCDRYHDLRCPILVGHSRKGFLAKIIGHEDADRTAATVGVALALAVKRIQVLRVHDVRPVREALLTFAASGGLGHTFR